MGASIVMGVPQNGWFLRGSPVKMDDLGAPAIFGNLHLWNPTIGYIRKLYFMAWMFFFSYVHVRSRPFIPGVKSVLLTSHSVGITNTTSNHDIQF